MIESATNVYALHSIYSIFAELWTPTQSVPSFIGTRFSKLMFTKISGVGIMNVSKRNNSIFETKLRKQPTPNASLPLNTKTYIFFQLNLVLRIFLSHYIFYYIKHGVFFNGF